MANLMPVLCLCRRFILRGHLTDKSTRVVPAYLDRLALSPHTLQVLPSELKDDSAVILPSITLSCRRPCACLMPRAFIIFLAQRFTVNQHQKLLTHSLLLYKAFELPLSAFLLYHLQSIPTDEFKDKKNGPAEHSRCR